MNRVFLLICFSFLFLILNAQDLPRWMTEEEQQLMPSYLSQLSKKKTSSPPPYEVRNMAEWEEVEYLVITWTTRTSILREIVRHGREEAKVLIVCSDSNSVKSYLQAGGVALNNVFYLEESFNSIWMRDYFGNTAYKNDVDSMVMVDWIYNRPRPADDKVAHYIANFLNIPLYETAAAPNRLVNTGGNYMSDGQGIAFSSNLVLDENPALTKPSIDGIMENFLGQTTYINMTNLPYDDIHHIDMHMKLMNENTLLVGEYPNGISDGPTIEANINYVLSNFLASNGEPFNLERIEMPKPNNANWPSQGGYYYTYANMVFVNNLVMVPVYNLPTDGAALERIKELMPGYKVVGIDCSSIIPLGGAIHCITHTVGVKDPLHLGHYPLLAQEDNGNNYLIKATANHISGIQSVNLFWTTDTTKPFNKLPMGVSLGNNLEYSNYIPNQPAGTIIYYYIEAEAQNGKTGMRPMPAPKGFYSFEILPFTGIEQDFQLGNVTRVFPNPSNGITAIEFSTVVSEEVLVSISDIFGKEVYQSTLQPFKTSHQNSQVFIDTAPLKAGIYMVSIKYGNSSASAKLLVK